MEFHALCKKLHFESLTWKHRNQALLRLRISVLTSWICRGLSNWTVKTRGDMALRLPGLVVGPEEDATEVLVQLDSDEEPGDIFVGRAGSWDR